MEQNSKQQETIQKVCPKPFAMTYIPLTATLLVV
jgi:hypothetical protein